MARVLLVDDHEIVRRGLRSLLESGGWSICGEAADGKTAITQVLVLKPDVIVMDISMPIMNGLDATKEIRRIAPKTKIIILSIHDSPKMKEEMKRIGAHDYIAKSHNAEELHDALVRVLQQDNSLEMEA
jgi:DNA-binding NarL/FixJ family response regulator